MIEIASLSREFRSGGSITVALDRIDLEVGRGRIAGLLGPNGSGKTTLFRIVAGIIRADAGSVRVMGVDLATDPMRVRAAIGLVTEEPGLPDRLTPQWHVSLHASLRGMPRWWAVRRARRVLREAGLTDEAIDTPASGLSRGVRQRVALARALVHDPPVLLLDEPTCGLDIEAAAWFRLQVARRAAEGACVLMATHDPREAESLCDDIVVLRAGRLLARGAANDLSGKAGTLEAAYRRLQAGPA